MIRVGSTSDGCCCCDVVGREATAVSKDVDGDCLVMGSGEVTSDV